MKGEELASGRARSAVEETIRLAGHESARVRRWALERLAADHEAGGEATVTALVAEKLADPSAEVRSLALDILHRDKAGIRVEDILNFARAARGVEARQAYSFVLTHGSVEQKKAAFRAVMEDDAAVDAFFAIMADVSDPAFPRRIKAWIAESPGPRRVAIPLLEFPVDRADIFTFQLGLALFSNDERLTRRLESIASMMGQADLYDVLAGAERPEEAFDLIRSKFGIDTDMGVFWPMRAAGGKVNILLSELLKPEPRQDNDSGAVEPWRQQLLTELFCRRTLFHETSRLFARSIAGWKEDMAGAEKDMLPFLLTLVFGRRRSDRQLERCEKIRGGSDELLEFYLDIPDAPPSLADEIRRCIATDDLFDRLVPSCLNDDSLERARRVLTLLMNSPCTRAAPAMIDFYHTCPAEISDEVVEFLLEGCPDAAIDEMDRRLAVETASEKIIGMFHLLSRTSHPRAQEIVLNRWERLAAHVSIEDQVDYLESLGGPDALRMLFDLWRPGEPAAARAALTLWEMNGGPTSDFFADLRMEAEEYEKEIDDREKIDPRDDDADESGLTRDLDEPLMVPLRCASCGREYHYDIGCFLYPLKDQLEEKQDDTASDAARRLSFGRLIKCKNCGGLETCDWTARAREIAAMEMLRFMALLKQDEEEAEKSEESGSTTYDPDDRDAELGGGRIRPTRLQMADGTSIRSIREKWQILRRQLDEKPDDPSLHLRLGNLYLKSRLFAESRKCFESALNINPNDIESLYNLGVTQFDMGRLRESLKTLQNVLKLGRRRMVERDKNRGIVNAALMDIFAICAKTGADPMEIISPFLPKSLRQGRLDPDDLPGGPWEKMVDLLTGDWSEDSRGGMSLSGGPAVELPPTLRAARNAPCPCGSGKKYKRCCLPKDRLRRPGTA